MAYPTWATASNLGSIASGVSSTFTITASSEVTGITLISTTAPDGFTFSTTSNIATLTTVAVDVVSNTTYNVVLRAQNVNGITDKTFTWTVSAAPAISWIQNTSLPSWTLGARREIPLTASWIKDLEYVLVSGQLPPGVFLDSSGVIYGIAGSNLVATNLNSDQWSIDGAASTTAVRTFSFTIRARSVEQKTIYVDKTFQLSTVNVTNLDASTINLTADSTVISADATNNLPIVLLSNNDLGTFRHSNQFLKQIRAWNPTGESINFELMGEQNAYDAQGYDEGSILGYDGYQSTTAPYLQVEVHSGYVTGQIPDIDFAEEYDSFSVKMTKASSTVTAEDSITAGFNLKIIGNDGVDYVFLDPNNAVIPENTIFNYEIKQGQTSDFQIKAYIAQDPQVPLFYNLVSGQLPPGLTLTPRGYISGKVSWVSTLGVYSFSVTAYNPSQTQSELSPAIIQTRDFSITVSEFLSGVNPIDEAYDLYYRALLPNTQRTVWRNLVTDQRIFNNSIIYRAEDKEFGRRLECEFLAFVGINTTDAAQFANTVSRNWSLKRFRLGNVHSASMTNALGTAMCDVIYVDIIDPQMNKSLRGPAQIVDIPNTDKQQYITEIYPASLQNQLIRLQDDPGQATDSLLPRWMTSPQADGRPLGLVPAAVLCYVLPGQGPQVLRKILTSSHKLSYIDFQVDRMVLKNSPILTTDTLLDNGQTVFDNGQTLLDLGFGREIYIQFGVDNTIYSINN